MDIITGFEPVGGGSIPSEGTENKNRSFLLLFLFEVARMGIREYSPYLHQMNYN